MDTLPGSKDKPLFTPGPLTTSATVKQAMLQDLGSRDQLFIDLVAEVREKLLHVAGVSGAEYTAIPMQGSGTFSVESVLSSVVARDGKVLVVNNGAYGKRMLQICEILGIATADLAMPESACPQPGDIAAALAADPKITDVAIVHCETTTGMFHPIEAIGDVVHAAGKRYIVDAMSSFGAVPINFEAGHIDYLVSSANKCIEGVPGFGFAIARLEDLASTTGRARSLSLDLLAQWKGLERNGQFRFTPPTHVLLAFCQALAELELEGGVVGRAARYSRNCETVIAGMEALGFETYLSPKHRGYIITSFRYPDDSRWSFDAFYNRLHERGYVIYPGKVSDAACFRIGNIGRLFESDMQDLLAAVAAVCRDMQLELEHASLA